jgi:hypothetical protein
VRSAKVLHCPNDFTHRSLLQSGSNLYDLEYLSYQSCDNNVPTYASVRTTDTSDALWKRQLMNFNGTTFVSRPPDATTVVTWCPFHRNQRDMDNVLFYDGSVQILPRSQSGTTGWQRTPNDPQ